MRFIGLIILLCVSVQVAGQAPESCQQKMISIDLLDDHTTQSHVLFNALIHISKQCKDSNYVHSLTTNVPYHYNKGDAVKSAWDTLFYLYFFIDEHFQNTAIIDKSVPWQCNRINKKPVYFYHCSFTCFSINWVARVERLNNVNADIHISIDDKTQSKSLIGFFSILGLWGNRGNYDYNAASLK